MKIAVSSTNKDIKSDISEVFARCPYFVIAEIKNKEIKETEVIKNESIDQNRGAGISTSQLMAEKNVEAVITGNIGPRALDVLNQFNIEVYSGKGSAEKALQEFIAGKLEKIS